MRDKKPMLTQFGAAWVVKITKTNTAEDLMRSCLRNYAYFPFILSVAVSGFLLCAPASAQQDVTPKMQPKIDAYKKKLQEWAAHPDLVKSVKEANAKGPVPGMANAKWRELKENDPAVENFVKNPVGQLVTKWMNEDAKGINKVVVSGDKSQRVAFTSMPAIYIGKGRPNFDTSFDEGKVWQQAQVQPDPSTQIPTVQVSAPVRDGGKIIGVLLVSLTAVALQ